MTSYIASLKKPSFQFFFCLLVSFVIVGFAQPDWSVTLCVISGSIGIALFWKAALHLQKRSALFWLCSAWYAAVQAVQLSWFLSDQYVGWPIFVFLPLFSAALGLQFGCVSILVLSKKPLDFFRIAAASSLWVIMEWSRLKFLSGDSWNPIGLMLSATSASMQCASLFGVFGLSFWIFFTNLLALKWINNRLVLKNLIIWIVAASLPYALGFGLLKFHEKQFNSFTGETLQALIVQTAILPEEKYPISWEDRGGALTPLAQIQKILFLLQKERGKKIDLILFSEGALPYGPYNELYYPEDIKRSFVEILGAQESTVLPIVKEEGEGVGNHYFARALANFFDADVIMGLEDVESTGEAYNAAFLFPPHSSQVSRYEKRILVPLGEYIPFEWCKRFLKRYGIQDSFIPGKEAKVYPSKKGKIGFSICYEETWGSLMRENRLLGANILVNLSNDVWYPHSRLPMVHYLHSRLRAVEGGVPLLRSCNTGVTCGIDSLGRTLGLLPFETHSERAPAAALFVQVPLYHYPTLYTSIGDAPLLMGSFGIVILFFLSLILGSTPIFANVKREY